MRQSRRLSFIRVEFPLLGPVGPGPCRSIGSFWRSRVGHGLGVGAVGVGEETATESAKVDSGKADRVAEMVEELMPDERRLKRECPLRW